MVDRGRWRELTDLCEGDCAELFDYCSENPIDAKIKLILQMSLVLIWGKDWTGHCGLRGMLTACKAGIFRSFE